MLESPIAIVEHWDGRYELVNFADFVREFPLDDEKAAEDAQRELVGAGA
jgi:hypothetical protein